MGEVKVQGHIGGPTSYKFTSFQSVSISTPIPEIWIFKNQIQGQGQSSSSNSGSSILMTHIPFIPCQSAKHIQNFVLIKNKNDGKRQNTLGCLDQYACNVKACAKHSPFAKNPDLAIIGERISGLTKILAKDFQLLGENKQIMTSHC